MALAATSMIYEARSPLHQHINAAKDMSLAGELH